MKILIADDDFINRLYIKELLEEGFETEEAKDGIETIEKLKTFDADVVLLDIMMPNMDGFQTLEKIRKNELTREISVIMVTAKVEKDDVVRAIRAGADDYIKKPIDQIELLAKIDIQKKYIANKKTLAEYQVYANIKDSMLVAERLQKALLPDKKFFNSIFEDNFILNLPKDIVSGDFYNLFVKPQKRIITLFDSVGHGVPASMMSIIMHFTISKNIENKYSNIIDLIRKIIIDFQIYLNHSEDVFFEFGFDCIFCEIDQELKQISCIGARRPLILIRENSNAIIVNNQKFMPLLSSETHSLYNISGDAFSIGLETRTFNTKVIEYQKDDIIYIFTDGYHDQTCGNENKRISKRGFYKLLLDMQHLPLKEQKKSLYNHIKKCIGNSSQIDDILVIGIKI